MRHLLLFFDILNGQIEKQIIISKMPSCEQEKTLQKLLEQFNERMEKKFQVTFVASEMDKTLG